jgi:hypothetical protein
MPIVFARLFRPALVIGLVLIVLALAVVLAMLAGGPSDERLLGPFRWTETVTTVA